MDQRSSPEHPEQPTGTPATLCAQDAAALDALVEWGYRPGSVPEALAPRAARAAEILALLDTPSLTATDHPGATREDLVAATLARIARHDAKSAELVPAESGWIDEEEAGLSPQDRDALEALVGAHFDLARVAHGLRPRAAAQMELLSLLSAGEPVESHEREARMDRTIAFIASRAEVAAARMRIVEPRPRARAFRFADLASIAAVVTIGTAAVWPAVTSMSARARETACLNNLASAGSAFGMYAGDFKSSLPMASASLAGMPWWNVNQTPETSNSANLFTLPRFDYISLDPLVCPCSTCGLKGKPAPGTWDFPCMDQVSYSFQNLFATKRARWGEGERLVVLADRSPVTLRSARNQPQDPFANSLNHGGRGQSVLFNDGAAQWATTPIIAGDNIWLPRVLEQAIDLARRSGQPVLLRGCEEPGCPEDSFLTP